MARDNVVHYLEYENPPSASLYFSRAYKILIPWNATVVDYWHIPRQPSPISRGQCDGSGPRHPTGVRHVAVPLTQQVGQVPNMPITTATTTTATTTLLWKQ